MPIYDLDRVTQVTYLNNDTEAFPTDDFGNRVGQVTQRDGVGKAHTLWLGLTKKTA